MKNSLPQLNKAYEICRKETQQWAKTFYLGTLLLPIEKRKAIWAIYVWCRRTDEIMDSIEASTKSNEELSDNLNEWEENTKNVFKGKLQSELDAVLFDTIEKFPQDIQPYLDMIDGQRMDLNKFRYEYFAELKLYCYRVAGTVGLMTQNVMGIDSAYTSAPSDWKWYTIYIRKSKMLDYCASRMITVCLVAQFLSLKDANWENS